MKFLYLSTALLIASSLVAMNNEDDKVQNRSNLYRNNNLDIFREEIKARIKQHELSKPKKYNSLCEIIQYGQLKESWNALSEERKIYCCNKKAQAIINIIKANDEPWHPNESTKKSIKKILSDYWQTDNSEYWGEKVCENLSKKLAREFSNTKNIAGRIRRELIKPPK